MSTPTPRIRRSAASPRRIDGISPAGSTLFSRPGVVLERLVVAGNDQSVEGEDARLRFPVTRGRPWRHHRRRIICFVAQDERVPADEYRAVSGLDDEGDVVRTVSRRLEEGDTVREGDLFEPHGLFGAPPSRFVP